MTETETLLKRSILYRRLIDEIEAIAWANFTPTQKHRMVQEISDTVDQVTLGCVECGFPVEPRCAVHE